MVPIPIPINSSAVIVQTDDPWMTGLIQFAAGLAGGLIAYAIGNHQQKKEFARQAEIGGIHPRNDAYLELLEELLLYEQEPIVTAELKFHLYKASSFGSLNVQKEILEILSNIDNTDGALILIERLRLVIIMEMGLEMVVDNKRKKLHASSARSRIASLRQKYRL
jgi:hypothetical protein